LGELGVELVQNKIQKYKSI
jgi:hypothetical protein